MEPQEIAQQLRKPEGQAGVEMGNRMNQSNVFTNKIVFEKTAVKDGETILEIGFGNGKLIHDLLGNANNVSYKGLDYSADMVREAIINNRELVEEGVCEFREGDFSAMPYNDNSFDKICTINTIYFQKDPEKCLLECFRVLKQGGSLYIGIRPRHVVKDFPFVQHGFTLYEPEEVEEMVKKAGFKDTGHLTHSDPPIVFNGQEVSLKSSCIFGMKK